MKISERLLLRHFNVLSWFQWNCRCFRKLSKTYQQALLLHHKQNNEPRKRHKKCISPTMKFVLISLRELRLQACKTWQHTLSISKMVQEIVILKLSWSNLHLIYYLNALFLFITCSPLTLLTPSIYYIALLHNTG
jgi:hypothetical protein